MTELQFERVFSKAQDLQTANMSQKEVQAAEQALKGFDSGLKRLATTKQAACVLNMMAMDFAGEYSQTVLVQVHDFYIANVTIIGEDKVPGHCSKKKSKRKK